MPTKPTTHNPLPPFLAARVAAQRAADKERRVREYNQGEQRRVDIAFYSSMRWVEFRAYLFTVMDPTTGEPVFALCRECRKAGRIVPTHQIDHIKPRKERPDLAFEESNLQGLCRRCHASKTRAGQ